MKLSYNSCWVQRVTRIDRTLHERMRTLVSTGAVSARIFESKLTIESQPSHHNEML
jgi:hypothetical protein